MKTFKKDGVSVIITVFNKEAYIEDENKNRLIDFKKNNLHLIGYSLPINKKIKTRMAKDKCQPRPSESAFFNLVTLQLAKAISREYIKENENKICNGKIRKTKWHNKIENKNTLKEKWRIRNNTKEKRTWENKNRKKKNRRMRKS